jgi:RNA polymerase sigma-70 factor (ECF subfamily)
VLVRRHQRRLLRVAESFVPSHAVAEEVVQDTWLAVVKGAERFEGRSTVKTWLFRILVNRARTVGAREPRTSQLGIEGDDEYDTRFGARFGRNGAWSDPPVSWADRVDDQLLASQLAARVHLLLERIPESQRCVFVLHDVEGLDASTVCEVLGLTAGNQRVLLHRARARIRGMLELEMELGEAD